MLDDMPAQPGTYLLVFESDVHTDISVGRLGQLKLIPGYYVYIGSAFGPGGLRARVRHHHGISQRPHWHLDYIRPHLGLREIWFTTDTNRQEHAWADSMYYTMHMQIPKPGLGSSDCQCESHFLYSRVKPGHKKMHATLVKNNNMHLELMKVL